MEAVSGQVQSRKNPENSWGIKAYQGRQAKPAKPTAALQPSLTNRKEQFLGWSCPYPLASRRWPDTSTSIILTAILTRCGFLRESNFYVMRGRPPQRHAILLCVSVSKRSLRFLQAFVEPPGHARRQEQAVPALIERATLGQGPSVLGFYHLVPSIGPLEVRCDGLGRYVPRWG